MHGSSTDSSGAVGLAERIGCKNDGRTSVSLFGKLSTAKEGDGRQQIPSSLHLLASLLTKSKVSEQAENDSVFCYPSTRVAD